MEKINSESKTSEKTKSLKLIISLLKEQNHNLHKLLEITAQKHKEEIRKRNIQIFIQLIPYMISILLIILGYLSFKNYLDSINQSVVSLQENYSSMRDSIQSAVGKMGDLTNTITDGIKNFRLF